MSSEVLKVRKAIKSWVSTFHNETVRGIRSLEKYYLSDEYKNIYRDPDPITWNQVTNDQQIDLIEKFYTFTPDNTIYRKPSNAGMKRADYDKKERRIRVPEAELIL